MRLALLCLMLVSTHALAADVLVEQVPLGTSPNVVLAVIEQAFIKRKWTVVEVTADSVTATIDREAQKVIRGRMRVAIEGQALTYTGSSVYRTEGGAHGLHTYTKPLSDSWVENLRRDISLTLAAIPDR